MARKVGSPKGAKTRADRYTSLIVRSRGACISCGSTQNLQAMHIISRRYSNTRCDLDNILCGCAKCHMHFTDNPVTFGEFVFGLIGQDGYNELVRKREQTTKVDWVEVAARMKARWEEIERAA